MFKSIIPSAPFSRLLLGKALSGLAFIGRLRKNWEFLGSEEAGPRAAVPFTILAGAKRHRPEPWACVRDVLLRLRGGETELGALLPDRWGASHPEHVLKHRLEESRRKVARQKEERQQRRAASSPEG